MKKFNGRAILLISGAGNQGDLEDIQARALTALSPFTLNVRENQSICLAGRIIFALDIDCDPAHLSAIEEDIRREISSFNCEVASEIV